MMLMEKTGATTLSSHIAAHYDESSAVHSTMPQSRCTSEQLRFEFAAILLQEFAAADTGRSGFHLYCTLYQCALSPMKIRWGSLAFSIAARKPHPGSPPLWMH